MKGEKVRIADRTALPDIGARQTGQAVRGHKVIGKPIALDLERMVFAIGTGAEIMGIDESGFDHGGIGEEICEGGLYSFASGASTGKWFPNHAEVTEIITYDMFLTKYIAKQKEKSCRK
jgi:hypothetical protein